MTIDPELIPQIISMLFIIFILFFMLGWQLCMIICRPKLKRFKVKRHRPVNYYIRLLPGTSRR